MLRHGLIVCCALMSLTSHSLAQTTAPVGTRQETSTNLQQHKTTTVGTKIPTAIFDYVAREEPAYKWELISERETDAGRIFQLRMTSQTWHGIVWQHQMVICEPKLVRHPQHAILYVNGGSLQNINREPRDIGVFMTMATLSGGLVASVYQVPNQPLFDNRYEDDLITETWLRYLKTGDKTWPLLFPMAKSAVKAMDTVQAVAKTKLQRDISGFVITGASKRGWTSWLTPVVDSRIKGTAPIVIDTLNFQKQIGYQKKMWGKFSEQIVDYTSKGLVKLQNENEADRSLREMMDPWTYREKLTLPKLIVNGTNDRYWCVDAVNNYWDDLKGPKFVLQVPNAGHNLKGGRDRAVATLASFFDHIASDRSLPQLDWKYAEATKTLTISSNPPARTATLWLAKSADGDFRDDEFIAKKITLDANGEGKIVVPAETDKTTAFFAEYSFGFGPAKWSLSSTVWRR